MLKRTSLSILIPLVFSFAAKAQADPTYMVGISFTFGSNDIGLTAKVLSDDEEETAVAAAGVSFYPMAEKKWGVDLGAGYIQDDIAATIGWDFLQEKLAVGVGYTDLEDEDEEEEYTPPEIDPSPGTDLLTDNTAQ